MNKSTKKKKQNNDERSFDKRIQLIASIILTAVLIVAVVIFAWLMNRKKAATMARINSPAKLSIKSGYAEDIINFEMSGIDVGNGTEGGSQNFVFCVEGEDVSKYNLQIAHTTNINFTYTLYRAHTDPNGTVDYKDESQVIHHYSKAAKFVDVDNEDAYGGYINATTVDGRLIANSSYTDKSYSADDYSGNHVQYYAEPLYWQSKKSIQANAMDGSINYNEHVQEGTENKFLNYYILEVSWNAGDIPEGNSKETDLIYITAQVD